MIRYIRCIYFTETPLKGKFRFDDIFQIFPLYSKKAPYSPYAEHYPFFLEYTIDLEPNVFHALDSDILEKLVFQKNLEREIIEVLTVLSNHRFFNNDKGNHWGVMSPPLKFEELEKEEREIYNNQYSSWCINQYVYPGLFEELIIGQFTNTEFPDIELIPHSKYFITDPVENRNGIISFPDTIESCLFNYFSLERLSKKKIKAAIHLINNGIELFEKMPSVAFLCFVSSIETMISIEMNDKDIEFCSSCKTLKKSKFACEKCGSPIWGIRKKFVEYLKKFVAGGVESQKKYKRIYDLRSNIAHNGQLLLSEIDSSSFEIDGRKNEWLKELEVQQIARISIVNWLSYKEKVNH
ncbi:MAG TPA: hypothetical protein DHV48_04260 [Prolixibacteraceae bacterium]|nr:hypothetical protein [Prolixibacteraceae bacterium]